MRFGESPLPTVVTIVTKYAASYHPVTSNHPPDFCYFLKVLLLAEI